jgi:6-phosphogluconolactonase (cycloisomerase 2 family)
MTRFIRWARATGLAWILLAVTIAAARPAAAGRDRDGSGHVYVQTNGAAGNAVVAFERHADGRLTHDETVATGGLGTSAGLGDQAAIAITGDERHLLAVNAGSDDVSLFDIDDAGLELADVQPVGDRPVSVAVHGNLVYVLNQGADTIQALRISDEDTLVNVAHSTRPLSTTDANAAQVGFSPDGGLLAVTEKDTQTIDTYVVRPNGRAVGPNAQPSSGATPFGFQFGPDGRLYVSEAPGSAASSYHVDDTGNISPVSASIPNNQAAACWLVVTSDGRFAYTANAGSANVSQYAIDADGALSLVGDGANGATDSGPVDLDVSDGDGFLYVLNSRSGSISAFSVDPDDGSLTAIAGVSGLATGWVGLVAI